MATAAAPCRLLRLNNKKGISHLLGIPDECRKPDYDFSINYDVSYVRKPAKNNKVVSKSERRKKYLSFGRSSIDYCKTIPLGEPESSYRVITRFVRGSEWLKKAQRKLQRMVSVLVKGTPYLHSTLRGTSYANNGLAHVGEGKSTLVLDLKGFFTQIDFERVKRTMRVLLDVKNDVAEFYAKILTSPEKPGSAKLVLGQGLPSSPLIAFMAYKSLFDYIYSKANKRGIAFTLYVDDMAFSAPGSFPQDFADWLFGLLKSKNLDNKLIVQKSKIHIISPDKSKTITGVVVSGKTASIRKHKYEELHCLYWAVVEKLWLDSFSLDEYYVLWNTFLKFAGNLIHLYQVEYNNDLSAPPKNYAHRKYVELYRTLNGCFLSGIKKKTKDRPYSPNNTMPCDTSKITDSYLSLNARLPSLKKAFPLHNHPK